MSSSRANSRRASIYVLTIVTVSAIASVVMIGVNMRGTRNAQSGIVEDIAHNNTAVLDATEYAIGKIGSDADWRQNAQKGAVFAGFDLGGRSYTSTVLDSDTLTMPTDSTTQYRVRVQSIAGNARDIAEFDLLYEDLDYLAYLRSLEVDAYWPMDEAPKSTNADDAAGSRDGTYTDPNVPGAGTNDENGLVSVFSTGADHLETPYVSDYEDDTEGTFSFWMKVNGTSNVITYGLFGIRFSLDSIAAASLTMTSRSLNMYIDDGGAYDFSHFTETGPGFVVVGQWHHVAISWGPAGVRIYVDGVLRAANPTCTEYLDTSDMIAGRQPLLIGAGYITTSHSVPKTGFDGAIAHFSILSNQLSASTIAELAEVKPDGIEMSIVDGSWNRQYSE